MGRHGVQSLVGFHHREALLRAQKLMFGVPMKLIPMLNGGICVCKSLQQESLDPKSGDCTAGLGCVELFHHGKGSIELTALQ